MKLCSIYSDVSDKIKGVVFARKLAEAEAEAAAARKRTIIIVCVCAGIALVAAAAAVGIYFALKQEAVKSKVDEIVEKVKAKLPKKKAADECECVECECEEAAEEAAAEEAAE